ITVMKDEHPRPKTTLEKLAKLRPIFAEGTITAGNASGINDGASALLMMSADKAEELHLKPLVKYVVSAVAGLEPRIMGLGPIEATKKALKRADLTPADIGLIELNEAFASQSIECIRQLELDPARVNVNGGAIAFGHPLGASGGRIYTTLVHEMKVEKIWLGDDVYWCRPRDCCYCRKHFKLGVLFLTRSCAKSHSISRGMVGKRSGCYVIHFIGKKESNCVCYSEPRACFKQL